MATVTWTSGGNGNFRTASRWSGNAVPGSGDTAVVDLSSGTTAILLNDAESVAGLTLNDPNATLNLTGTLALNAGTLTAQAGTLTISGTLEGGTLAQIGATVRFTDLDPSTSQVVTPELLNLTVLGTLDISATPTTLEVQGLQTQGIRIGAGSELLLLDSEV
jgi:hypothetical protein